MVAAPRHVVRLLARSHALPGMTTLVLVALAVAAIDAHAQVARWRRLTAVPESLVANRSRAEDLWNELFAQELEASAGNADSAGRLRDLTRRYARLEEPALGTRIAADALKLRAQWKGPDLAARALAWRDENLGWSPALRATPDRAESLLAHSGTTYRRLGDRRREAWAAGRRGGIAIGRADFPRAWSLQLQALALRRVHGDSAMVANTLNDLGGIALNLGRPRDAIVFLTEARSIREQRQDPRRGSTLGLLGTAYARVGSVDSAAAAYRNALETPLAPAARTDLLINYGEYLAQLGRLPDSEDTLRLALALTEDTGDAAKNSAARSRLSDVALAAGRVTECLELRSQAVDEAREAGDTLAWVPALQRRGTAWLEARRVTTARTDLLLADSLAAAIEDSTTLGRCRVDLGLAAWLDGDTTGARRLTRSALDLARTTGDEDLERQSARQLAGLALEAGRLEEAREWYRNIQPSTHGLGARDLSDRLNLAVVDLKLGQLDRAETELRSIAATADSGSLLLVSPAAHANLAHVAWLRADTTRALQLSRENLDRVEALRARQHTEEPLLGLFADHADEYDSILQFLWRSSSDGRSHDRGAEAFAWSERARARVLVDRLASRAQADSGIRGLAEVQASLAPDQALVEYALGDSLGLAWVVRHDSFEWIELPPRRVLRARITIARRALQDPVQSRAPRTQALLDSLGATLIGRLGPKLTSARRIIVVPDGPLAFLPFECLRIGGSYLVERAVVSYTPSASAYLLAPGPRPGSLVVALGNPAFAGGESTSPVRSVAAGSGQTLLSPLPFSAAEVSALERLATSRPFVALTGARATRTGLLAVPDLGHAAIIHLATHGQADDLEPQRSALWFAPDSSGGAPGRISSADVSGLDLGADLVTLAACESGLGQLERGEGVLGFTRAFLAAGARTVVASLWKVSDAASAKLMSDFYTATLERGASRAEALTAAKRHMLKLPAGRSPFLWAPFVMVGADGPVAPVSAPTPGAGSATPNRR